MKRRFSLAKSHATLLNTSLLTVGFFHATEGFRASDLEFFFLLYGNWLEYEKRDEHFGIEPMQVARFLKYHVVEKNIEARLRKNRSRYFITYEGAIRILTAISQPRDIPSFEEIIFTQYILRTYSPFIEKFLLKSQVFVSQARLAQIRKLMDYRCVVEHSLNRIDEIIKDLENRIEESEEMARFTKECSESGVTAVDTIKKMHERFRYQLSMRKSLKDLYSQLPPDMQHFELNVGLWQRNKQLFEPVLQQHKLHAERLKQLLNS